MAVYHSTSSIKMSMRYKGKDCRDSAWTVAKQARIRSVFANVNCYEIRDWIVVIFDTIMMLGAMCVDF